MLEGYRIVPFIPAGRKRQMSVLIDNLRRFPEIDEVQLWLNTDPDQVEDTEWIRELPSQWSKCKLFERPGVREDGAKQYNTRQFYINTVSPDTIYFRFDDDICYIDDNYFKNMVKFRLENPDYFLVMGNIWNNAIVSYIQQHIVKSIDQHEGCVQEPFCMDMVGWQSEPFAAYIHRVMFEHIAARTEAELFFDRYDLTGNKRFSISNFCFFGKDFKEKFNGVIPIRDEEIWLTEDYPQSSGLLNTVCGTALVVHYSFFAQRPWLDELGYLERYREIAKQKLSEAYYSLLER
jgi:hypothetical protein